MNASLAPVLNDLFARNDKFLKLSGAHAITSVNMLMIALDTPSRRDAAVINAFQRPPKPTVLARP